MNHSHIDAGKYFEHYKVPMFTSTEWTLYNDNEKEDNMSLAQQYLFSKRDAKDRAAIRKGAMKEDGTLTEEGKDLLLNLLLQDDEIRTRFNVALTTIDNDKEDNGQRYWGD